MSNKNYIILNGLIQDEKEAALLHNNRAFFYGDGFFESMHWHNGNILFQHDHFDRISKAFSLLKMNSDKIKIDFIFSNLPALISQNNITGDARIRITFYRISDGTYTPNEQQTGFYIQAGALSVNGFELNENGLISCIYKDQRKTNSSVSSIKSLSSLVSVMAGIHARENNWDDALLMNNTGNVIESYNSNLFITNKGMLYTPPISDGCLDGVMRKQVIKMAQGNNITIQEKSIFPEDIENADEILLTNAVQGIRWVMKCGNKIYNKVFADQLFALLKRQIN